MFKLLLLLTSTVVAFHQPVHGDYVVFTNYVGSAASRTCAGTINSYEVYKVGDCLPSNAKRSVWEPRNTKISVSGGTITGTMYAATDTTCSGTGTGGTFTATIGCSASNPNWMIGRKIAVTATMPTLNGKFSTMFIYKTTDCSGERYVMAFIPQQASGKCLNYNQTNMVSKKEEVNGDTVSTTIYPELDCKGAGTTTISTTRQCSKRLHTQYNTTASTVTVPPPIDPVSSSVVSASFSGMTFALLSMFASFAVVKCVS